MEWYAGQFQSNIHQAGDCGSYSGTTHVDGSAIDSADFPWLHHAVLFFALAPVIGLVAHGIRLEPTPAAGTSNHHGDDG